VNKINSIKVMIVCYTILVLVPMPPVAASQGTRTALVKQASVTIQEAINEASPGDTIHVPAGTYYEHVFVNKTVSLVGENRNTTIIDGSDSGTIIQVTSDGVSITGFKLQNSGYGWTMQGVYVYRADNCTIKDNTLYNVCHNVRLNYSRDSQILDNTIDGPSNGVTMYGIRLENSINCTAAGNRVSVRVGAIHLENATGCIVRGNYLVKNDQGIRLYSPCTYNLITENNVCDNNYDGMIATMPPDATFLGNRIFHNNFVNNTNPFIVQATGTFWDNGVEGNYWARCQSSDLNKDGIGDVSCIFGTERDSRPLMGPFSSFAASQGLGVDVISDSAVEDFAFFESNNTIRMHVFNATANQTFGFCRIAIPHALMNETYHVSIDGAEPIFANYTLYDDGKSRWIYFSYQLSEHEVLIIPEFPSSVLQVVFLAATMFSAVAAVLRPRRKKMGVVNPADRL